MNERRYFAHAAESAVSGERPLADELSAACKAIRKEPTRVRDAIAHAKDGHLGLALERLRLDRIVSAVALLAPRATFATSARLRELPSTFELVGPTLLPAFYLTGLLAIQLVVVYFLAFHGRAGSSFWLLVAVLIVLGSIVVVGAIVIDVIHIRTSYRGGLFALLLRDLRLARLLAASAVLARHGVAPADAIARLAGPARIAETDAAELLGTAALDDAALDTLADWLAGEGARRALRAAAILKTAGAGALVLIGVITIGSMYWALGVESLSLLEGLP